MTSASSPSSSSKLHFSPDSHIAHTVFEWVEANGIFIRCQFSFLDRRSEFQNEGDGVSAIKYIPLLESAKSLLYMSLVDLTQNQPSRVKDSFEFFFKDHTVVIYNQLLERKVPYPINLKILKNTIVKVYVADKEEMQGEEALMRLVDERQVKISNFLVKGKSKGSSSKKLKS